MVWLPEGGLEGEVMGRRGEIWVVAQALLLALYLAAPLAGGSVALLSGVRAAGWALAGAGAVILGWSALRLGRSLTPFPRPREHGVLVTDGPYGIVRHPIYAGVVLTCFGISLGTENLLRLAVTGLLLVFFDLKSRREERWLEESYPAYPNYKRRVKKLIPWLY